MAVVPRYRPGRGRNLTTRAPCLYPGCRRVLDVLPVGGGRTRNFCSDGCRANFHNIQRQLEALIRDIRTDLDHATADDQRTHLERDLTLAEIHLARFRTLQPADASRTTSGEDMRLPDSMASES